ncbi:MAG TPA: prolipoprotein diacylglyceryl transferase family protein, partial [Gammaproteobacteria bacterium]|nr:prolipoprotein diacylglyceryl transferase family protein [Gammaproteobacteria bacterium]
MLTYPLINPVAFHLGSWPVYWYGLAYLVGLLLAWILLSYRARSSRQFTKEEISDFIFFVALGVIIGGRLGYMIFYDWPLFLSQPLLLF